jgi:hypothetical protein
MRDIRFQDGPLFVYTGVSTIQKGPGDTVILAYFSGVTPTLLHISPDEDIHAYYYDETENIREDDDG